MSADGIAFDNAVHADDDSNDVDKQIEARNSMAPNAIEHENHFEFEPPIQLISIEKDA